MKRTVIIAIVGLLVPAAAARALLRQAEKKQPMAAPGQGAGGAMGGAGAMAMPKPAEELSQLKMFVGNWKCDGKFLGAPNMGPEHPVTATVKGNLDLDSFWYSMRYEEKKTKQNPTPLKGLFLWGYDAKNKRFVSTGIDAMGGWGHQTSPGWEGDKLVFSGEGVMMGEKMQARDTFVKKSDKELTHTGEVNMKGQWIKMDEETCKK